MSTTTRRAQAMATHATYASAVFKPVKSDLKDAGTSMANWLEHAREEYRLFRMAVAALDKDDVQLANMVQVVGVEAALELFERLGELEKKYKAGVEVTRACAGRILCSMSRVCPPQRRKPKPAV